MNTLTGVEKIRERILSDARASADKLLAGAREKADGLLDDAKKQAAEKTDAILAEASAHAALLAENAASSVDSRERSSLLFLKNEYLTKAISAAKEAFLAYDRDKKIACYASLVASCADRAFNGGDTVSLAVGSADKGMEADVIRAAKEKLTKAVTLTVSDRTPDIAGGFLLICGDIEVNCSADALFAELAGTLEKPILSVLFGA